MKTIKAIAIFTIAISFLKLTASIAETCPTVKNIKKNNFSGWQAVDSDDGKPLSPQRLAQLKKTVDQFVLAEWDNSKNKNSTMHCYYRDKEGYPFEAYLKKDHFAPENSKKIWYSVSGSLQCAADMNKCQFNLIPQSQKQLARG